MSSMQSRTLARRNTTQTSNSNSKSNSKSNNKHLRSNHRVLTLRIMMN